MKNKRVLQFALAGLLAALTLQIVGYMMDHAASRISVSNQVLYNWLTLLFSPVSFFLRLGRPDGPIVAGWGAFFAVLLSNALLYGSFCKAGQLVFGRLHHHLANADGASHGIAR